MVALAVLVSAASRPAVQQGGKAIAISKHSRLANSDGTANLEALDSHLASTNAKILRGLHNLEKTTGTEHTSTLKDVGKRGYGDGLTDYQDVLWYGDVEVGTPPVSVTVVFDTGSSDLFLSSSNCDTTCSGHTLWDPKSSSTAQDLGKSFELTFGGGAVVWGEAYTDAVSIGGITATNQTLGAASSYTSVFQLPQFPADGVMGMGFQSISVFEASPFFQTLISESQVTDSVFSFKLSSTGSELYIGGSNTALYSGDLIYAPVTNQGFWLLPMDNIESDGLTILSFMEAIIDTGTTLIAGPASDVSTLYNALGGSVVPSATNFYTFPCDSFPTISLGFGGTAFPIPASALNLGPVSSGSSDCVSAITAQGTGYTFWVVGDTFLRGVYTAFDVGNSRVGFALLA